MEKTTMIGKAISAFLKDGEHTKNLLGQLRTLVRRAPVTLTRVHNLLDETPLYSLSMYHWTVQFRTEAEIKAFDKIMKQLVREATDGEVE